MAEYESYGNNDITDYDQDMEEKPVSFAILLGFSILFIATIFFIALWLLA